METVRYKHAHFSARFPKAYSYSASHYWMAPTEENPQLWRVGFTKFATRMLGELVEAKFGVQDGDAVEPGNEIGSVEGFKAASDVYCVMSGIFRGMNAALLEDACIVRSDPYGIGWLYQVEGKPEAEHLDVDAYIELLDRTINRMQEQRDAQHEG